MKEIVQCPVCYSKESIKRKEIKDYFLTQEAFELWECQQCKTWFTHPIPPANELTKYYDSPEYFSHTTEKAGLTGKLYALLRSINIKYKYNIVTARRKTGTLLDIGCGTAELLNHFKQKGWECLGIEPNEKARLYAQTHYHLPVKEEKELENIPDGSFDVISMWHVLEHVPEIEKRIKQIKRILRRHGTIIIALPNPSSWDADYYNEYWAGYDVPRHLYHFSPEAFRNFCKINGLQLTDIKPLKLDAYYVSLLSEKYKQKKIPYLSAITKGFLSNYHAKKTGNYSSLIYILKKQ